MTFEIGKDYVYVFFPMKKFTLVGIETTERGTLYLCKEFNGKKFTFDSNSRYEKECKELVDKYKIIWK